ncbi:MAG: 2-hydroxyacyl-CoA dehydratase family protein [Dehalococcoidales bacterium]|nr:2-hydroxyacyl-CoA dehydratase family protein [Dehalococcoidales bacterium]
MVAVASKGLARAQEIYQNRDKRVRQLRSEGHKVFGYINLHPVLEMLTAFDIIPYRIFGDMREPITKADTYMATAVCPFIRSSLDLGLKGKYDFLDGTLFAHSCDIATHVIRVWNVSVQTPNTHFIDTPHTTHQASLEHYKELLQELQQNLEEYTGKKLTKAKLKTAIVAHNQQRALVRELYDLRKPDPPLISAAETLQVVKTLMSLPVKEGNQLLREVINEVKERKGGPVKKSGRLLVWGPVLDDTAFMEMIESLDANIVIDDTCVGSRAFFDDVKLTDDPLDGLAYHYLIDIKCPRTFRESIYSATKKDYMADLESRFSYLKDYAKDWNVNGVILQAMRYCESHSYEVPGLKDYFDHLGLPSIYLEIDYSEAALAPLRTRAQGLIEVIG